MRNKSILLAFVLLLIVVAAAKKENDADFDMTFTVTGTSQPVGNHYCPMSLRAASIEYSVYAESWQCVSFPVGTQVQGRLVRVAQWLRYDQGIEVMYHSKGGKMETQKYVVSASKAVD
jgi:hypothetical protein